MTEILIHIKNRRKVSFIKELLGSFNYVELKELEKEFNPAEKRMIRGLKQSFKEIKLHEQGKIKLKPLQELLDEL
jgi:hypothetical protein